MSQTKIITPEVTTAEPHDPRWTQVREVADQLKLCGRLFLRGQVKLGMLLATLKKEIGRPEGRPSKNSADSAKFLPWHEIVQRETGYSRRQADEFIRLFEATKAKLKSTKKLTLPAPARKDVIVLFQVENPLALTEEQWEAVDLAIGTLTTGETQASLMQELGIVPKPKSISAPGAGKKEEKEEIPTAGQLAFHFFEAVAAPIINARTNPDYKALLLALPAESTEDQPLSLATLEAETRALLADIEEARRAAMKPAKGKALS